MRKSKWIELIEWCTLAAVVLFVLGVYLTQPRSDDERGGDGEFIPEQLAQ